jgi:flavin-dependent thymidylate synthase
MSKGTDIQKWADEAMFAAEPMEKNERGEVRPKVTLLWATPDPLGAISAACRMYEGKVTRSLSEVTDDERHHYWEQVKKTHLKAPLEFVKLHFFIEGVTRAFTHQMVRQRTAVYAQESLRFAVKEDLADEVPLPPSIRPDTLEAQVWREGIEAVDHAYSYLVANGVPAEDARGLLPHSVTTRLNYCTDLRALLDHAGNRLCTQAQFEWRYVFAEIVKAIRTHRPEVAMDLKPNVEGSSRGGAVGGGWQFELIADDGLFKPVCYRLGHCPFTADFDRKCVIRERVQEGKWDWIDDKEWLLDPTAAR